MATCKDLGIKRGVVPPMFGWRERQYYEVQAAFSENNTISTYIFYSGFLTCGQPSGYNCILSPTLEGKPSISDVYYLKAIKRLEVTIDD